MYLKIRIFADSNIKPHLKKAISLAEIYCENKNSFTAYNSTLFKTSKKVEKLVVAYSLYPSNNNFCIDKTQFKGADLKNRTHLKCNPT